MERRIQEMLVFRVAMGQRGARANNSPNNSHVTYDAKVDQQQ
jgi:hypothetical protein